MTRRDLRRLCDFSAGQQLVIREAQDDHPERLRRWQELGLVPGAVVCILSYQPLDDLFEVKVGDRVVTLGSEGLAGLHGQLSPE
jgi:DtxR family Mn-dependent transcriptional regulator